MRVHDAFRFVILGLDPGIHVRSLRQGERMLFGCSRLLSRYHAAMTGYVYMTASQKRGTIYIGVTNSLGRRIPEHKAGDGSRFTGRYGVQRLVWYEEHHDMRDAIRRERSLKRWLRQWKIDLIEKANPEWEELFRGWGW